MITEKDVQGMKENKEAFMFWPEECKAWANENKREFGFLGVDKDIVGVGNLGEFCVSVVYRLRPDYELPKKRWFINVTDSENGAVYSNDKTPDHKLLERVRTGDLIEINELQLSYYTRPEPVEGFTWVLKAPVRGEFYKEIDGRPHASHIDFKDTYVWCQVPVEKKPFEKIYEVKPVCGVYYMEYDDGSHIRLVHVFDHIGFAGWQAEQDAGWKWRLCLPSNDAVPVRVRFFEEVQG